MVNDDRKWNRNDFIQEKAEPRAFATGRKDEPERGVQKTKGGSNGTSRGHNEEQRWMEVNE